MIESTHFNQKERLSKLLALISLALCWAILIGEWLHEQIPLKIKKHRRIKNGCNWCDFPKDLHPHSALHYVSQ